PYMGNLIYIDFWALWCRSCRQGMIDQKKIVEHFADKPFKVIYVSDDVNIAGSNQWLEKKEIPGEHIYISSENWKRISEYFNFNYIPFGVLIGKDGNLIKTHFYLDHANAEKEIERHLKE
ncbi:MAG: redoxin domain-containing protein, partial [Muribaculaceae bacterium]|nr:redoxin domain-containing protein [Muribaculaceae bacterium]